MMKKGLSVLLVLLLIQPLFGEVQFPSLGNQLGITSLKQLPQPEVTAIIDTGDTPEFYRLAITVVLPDDTYLYAEDPSAFSIQSLSPYGEVVSLIYPEGEYSEQAERALYRGSVTFLGTIQTAVPFPENLEGLDTEQPYILSFTYQLCDDSGVCFLPIQETTTLSWGNISYDEDSGSRSTSFWLMLLFALLGGILLNFMPCVLPVISLRIIGIAQGAEKSISQLKKENYLFSLGMGTIILLLGVVTLVIRAAGVAVGWGFQFQNPLFTMGMILILFLFSLSLFGLFEIPGLRVSSKTSGLGTFGMGSLAALMAAPCTAPLLAPAIGFALSQGFFGGLLFFTLIAIGFALPLALITRVPKIWKALPKPGKWMIYLRYIMGVVLLGMIGYLGISLRLLIARESLTLFGIFLITLGTLLGARKVIIQRVEKRSTKKAATGNRFFVGVFLIVALLGWGLLVVPASKVEASVTVKIPQNWETFSQDTIMEYESQGRAMFIAFSASWCSTCKLNEKRVLFTKTTAELFAQTNTVPLYGDFTRFDPYIAEWIEGFQRSGVPLYLYKPEGESEYMILPQILSHDIMKTYLGVSNG